MAEEGDVDGDDMMLAEGAQGWAAEVKENGLQHRCKKCKKL